MADPSSRWVRPVAVGLVRHPPGTGDARRRRVRIEQALRADEEGYALADIVEIDDVILREDGALLVVEGMAVRFDAYAVLVTGAVDRARVEDLAERLRLLLVDVPEPGE